MGGFWRTVTSDSQLRWIGPEKGVIQFGVPVCPHAGGVGLNEYVQHLSLFDYIAVSGSLEGRYLEFVDQLHEHFLDPVLIENARNLPPTVPGYSITMRPESLEAYTFPDGSAWKQRLNAHVRHDFEV
jgi:L-fuconate dehydratase